MERLGGATAARKSYSLESFACLWVAAPWPDILCDMHLSVLAMPFRTRVLFKPGKATPRSIAKKIPPLKEGRRSAKRRTGCRIEKRCGARPFSRLPLYGEDRGRRDLMERARSPFGAPPRHFAEVLSPARLRAALPGITGCKREDPLRHQCSEHLAVRHAPDGTMPKPPVSAVYRYAPENRSRSASRSTLAKGVLRERDFGYVAAAGTKVKGNVALLGTRRRAELAQRNPPSAR
jgi:hypothetical protein